MKTSSPASESRRSFLKASLAAVAAGSLLGRNRSAFADIPGITFGVQLYMLRRQAMTDLAGVFRAIHDANFAQVELYPIAYDHPAPELRRMVEDAGLGAVAGHFDYPGLEGKLDYAQQLGLKYLVCPMIPRDQWTSLAGFGQAADLFNRVGKQLQARGMEFVFHNHDYEFRPLEGSTGFNYLMQHTDPALVKLEFDLYWLTQAGQDPLAMMKTHADRLRLIHLKDRLAGAVTSYTPDAPQYFTELGRGTIPWRSLLLQAHAQGINYVEGQLTRSKKSVTLRGLNQDHNHDLKDIFKGAATRVSSSRGPLRDFYEHLLAKGSKPTMARLTLARKIAAITLAVWKKEVDFDVDYLKSQAA